VILRPATALDASAICAITNAVVRDTLITFTTDQKTEPAVAADIATRGPGFIVAELAGEVAGFATYAPFRAGPGYARTQEHTIHLTPAAQGRGLGRALMARLEQVAAANGLHVLVAGISSANPGAVAFHRALGFVQVGRMPQVGHKGGQWLDLVLMQKILPPMGATTPDIGVSAR
jgi:L-amino acid N-acyltransferase YncA